MEQKPNYYAIIPAEVRYDKELRPNEKLFFGEIVALSNTTGVCTASNNYFSTLYDVVPSAISKWVKDLEEKQYIDVEYIKNGKEIIERRIRITGIHKYDKVFTKVIEGYSQKTNRGYSQKLKENNTSSINNTSINNNKEIYKERFEEFYQAYPKHLKKVEVEKWFYKNKPDETLFNTIMTQLEKFKKTKEWKQTQYIPYPSTWLNQKRWEDEIKTQEDIDKEILDYLKEMNPDETE